MGHMHRSSGVGGHELDIDAFAAADRRVAKGSAGAREALAHLRRGGVLGMLVDQKLNEGLAVPFFGRPAMTTPALAQFALRFRCPVIPVHPVRLGPARFRVIGALSATPEFAKVWGCKVGSKMRPANACVVW